MWGALKTKALPTKHSKKKGHYRSWPLQNKFGTKTTQNKFCTPTQNKFGTNNNAK